MSRKRRPKSAGPESPQSRKTRRPKPPPPEVYYDARGRLPPKEPTVP